jgi:hypothetical protein
MVQANIDGNIPSIIKKSNVLVNKQHKFRGCLNLVLSQSELLLKTVLSEDNIDNYLLGLFWH